MRGRTLFAAAALAALAATPAPAGTRLIVTWHPAHPRLGDIAWIHVRGLPDGAGVEGSVGTRTLSFFPYASGQAALLGIDLGAKPGAWPWQIATLETDREPRTVKGRLKVEPRTFPVQHLTVPPQMSEPPDPETEKRAEEEARRLTILAHTITPERLWRGRFVRPVGGTERGSGFGARRVINGRPRMPHGGTDYRAPAGTPVVAANAGRVALTAEYFFPGRLVALDHGLGVYTLYFHLETVDVTVGDFVERGQTLGTVGATGRATGPHLHFGAQVGGARVDPAALLDLRVLD